MRGLSAGDAARRWPGKREVRVLADAASALLSGVDARLRQGDPVAAREAAMVDLQAMEARIEAAAAEARRVAMTERGRRGGAAFRERLVRRAERLDVARGPLMMRAAVIEYNMPAVREAQETARRVALLRAEEREAARKAQKREAEVRRWQAGRVTAEVVERDCSGMVVLRGAAEVPAWTRLQGVEPWMAEAGRIYAALAESVECAGAPSQLGRIDGGRWGGGSATDARLRKAELLAACRAALGEGEALGVKRPVRVGGGGAPDGRRFTARRAEGEMLATRRPVLRRVLADSVLIGGASLADVLAGHGWCRKGRPLDDIRAALVAVLGDLADALGRREARPAAVSA